MLNEIEPLCVCIYYIYIHTYTLNIQNENFSETTILHRPLVEVRIAIYTEYLILLKTKLIN
jgi:hypothetical protein